MRMGCMQGTVSSIGWTASVNTNEIVQGGWQGPLGAYVAIPHHAYFQVCSWIRLCSERAVRYILNQRLSTWRARFHQVKVDILLAVDCIAIRANLRKSRISYRSASWGIRTARQVGNRSLAYYYYISNVYEDLSSGGSRFKSYGGSTIRFKRNMFLKWANACL